MSCMSAVYERMRDEFMKKVPHFPGGAVHAFGMPLHADGKRMGVQFDRLNRAVLRMSADRDAPAGEIHCLVVEAVYIQAGACVLPQPAPALDTDAVADFAAVCRLLHMIQDPARDQRHVLPDRAAAGHA